MEEAVKAMIASVKDKSGALENFYTIDRHDLQRIAFV